MTDLDPNKIAPAWTDEPWWRRARASVLLLSVHGFITENQARDAYERIADWEAAAEKVLHGCTDQPCWQRRK